MGVAPTVPALVVAQVSRSPRQAQLRRLLRSCRVVPFSVEHAHAVGRLLASASRADVVDAHVVLIAAHESSAVVTSDVADLRHLAAHLTMPVEIREI